MVWIKICGITSRRDAEAVSGVGADSLGFIFSTDSPRKISLWQAKDAVKGACGTSRTGVFVNEDPGKLLEYSNVLDLDYIQLSGEEDLSYVKDLKKNLGDIKVIKALRIGKQYPDDMKRKIEAFLEFADYILFDSYHRYKYGGTGKTLDWGSARGLADPERLIVSGGLDHENVCHALDMLAPFGVDASSRLEVSPGKKDLKKVQLFIAAARSKRQD